MHDIVNKSGNRIFFQPNVMNKNYFVPLKYEDRKQDIILRNGYHEFDTVKGADPCDGVADITALGNNAYSYAPISQAVP